MRGGASCPRYGGGGLGRADHVPRGDSERGDRDRSRSGAGQRLAESGRECSAVTASQLSAVRSMEAELCSCHHAVRVQPQPRPRLTAGHCSQACHGTERPVRPP